jgi:hypothetical protein
MGGGDSSSLAVQLQETVEAGKEEEAGAGDATTHHSYPLFIRARGTYDLLSHLLPQLLLLIWHPLPLCGCICILHSTPIAAPCSPCLSITTLTP